MSTPTPLEALQSLAALEVDVTDGLRHIEIYTLEGLLTLMWHGPPDAENVVVMCGGAMGGTLGPAGGLFHHLGSTWAEQGIGSIRVSYRKPNDLPRCLHDARAATDLAVRSGAKRFVTMGHSFGGAVALQAGVAFKEQTAGVVLLSTQSAGCESGDQIGDTPVLLLHGDRDEILPPAASELVQVITGGQLEILPNTGHLLSEASDILHERLEEWVPARFAEP